MEYKSVFVLGRQPAIGKAELESLLGASHVESVSEQTVASDVAAQDVPFARLGGSIRVCKVLAEIDSIKWPEIASYLIKTFPDYLDELPPEGKLKLGLSAFDLHIDARQLLRTGLELKKVCKRVNRSVRLVPNTEPVLSSAQVLHNQLTGSVGMELVLVRHRHKTILAVTAAVQDINAYARRDQNRPKRDARVGMLPPKLAQVIVNLATSTLPALPDNTVLDPFCGTGVVLQEAGLMGYGIYGTDLEPRMTEYSAQNLEWLTDQHPHVASPAFQTGDATSFHWDHNFTTVASETYLGRPLSSWPKPETLQEIIGTCNLVIEKFLRNIAEQTPAGMRLCLAIPAWNEPNGRTHHLPLLDHLEKMGYNRVSFEHVRDAELVYYRPEQIVARELLVITRK